MKEEFDPYPKFPKVEDETFEGMRQFLVDKKVPPFPQINKGPGEFDESGCFQVVSRNAARASDEGFYDLWASNLLRFNEDDYRIWVRSNGFIEVRTYNDDLSLYLKTRPQFVIAPGNVWFAESDAGWPKNILDQNSGYLAMPYHALCYSVLGKSIDGSMSKDDLSATLKDSLQKAQKGKKPDFLTKVPFARIPEEYATHLLITVLLTHNFNVDLRDPEYETMVVIDTQDKTLVPRIVDFPLHPDRWT